MSDKQNIDKLDLPGTSQSPEVASAESKAVFSGGDEAVASSTTEKHLMAGDSTSGVAGILHKSSKDSKKVHQRNGISRNVFFFSLTLVALSGFIAGTRNQELFGAVAPLFGIKASSETLDMSTVQQVFQQLKVNYDGELDNSTLIDGASRGLVAAAGDRYTVFLDQKEAVEFAKELNGEVSGIGAEIGVRSNEPTILRVVGDSPAEKAGVLGGDTIVSVNDVSMSGLTSSAAAEKIRGEVGTSVKLITKRGSDTKNFTITRAKVNDPSVRSRVQDGIGIMTISRFNDETGTLATKAAKSFREQGVRAVILDLRDNGGGYLDSSVGIAGLWLDNKLVVTEKIGDKVADSKRSGSSPILGGIKTVVLVNSSSASASEIVAGALQDHKAATLIGEKTFGKGSVQKILELSGGRELKVTSARWYTPNNKNITKDGISPDKVVKLTEADMDADNDPQLEAAIAAIDR